MAPDVAVPVSRPDDASTRMRTRSPPTMAAASKVNSLVLSVGDRGSQEVPSSGEYCTVDTVPVPVAVQRMVCWPCQVSPPPGEVMVTEGGVPALRDASSRPRNLSFTSCVPAGNGRARAYELDPPGRLEGTVAKHIMFCSSPPNAL